MMQAHREENNLFEEVSIRGLMGELIDQVRELRPTASRNTVHLALKSQPTTPLRQFIQGIAKGLLNEDKSEPSPAEAAG